MDAHVKEFAQILQEIVNQQGGEVYETTTFDDAGTACELVPAARLEIDGRTVNIVPFDVPGDLDHVSIITDWVAGFTLNLRHEGGWDWVKKRLGAVEDHQVGVPDFDRTYLVGGQPATQVTAFLHQASVREEVQRLGSFLALIAENGFIRLTLRLSPEVRYTREHVQSLVSTVLGLSRFA